MATNIEQVTNDEPIHDHLELENRGSTSVPAIEHDFDTSEQVQLPPVDGGRDAWRVLLAAFTFEALFWGFPTSYGVFQAYYSSLPQFAADRANIPVAGTLAQSLVLLGAPLATAVVKRFPHRKKLMIRLGWPLCICGLLAASFANNVSSLIATQGLIYGLGFSTMVWPVIDMVSEWWLLRRGMAFGLISASSGCAGTVMPIILETLLQRYGYKTTLRACAVAMFVLTAPLLPLLKGRLPASGPAQRPRANWSFLRNPLFYFYALATMVQGLGFYIPPIFISSYSIAVGVTSTQAAVLLAVMAASQTVGQFAFGWLSDKKLHVSLLTSFCCVIASIATATLWGLGKSLPVLIIYSMCYGFFAFGFGTMRVAMSRAVSSEQSAMLTLFSIFVFLQGLGNVLVGPITAGLMSGMINIAEYGASRYKASVIFVAASSMLGAVLIGTPHAAKRCGTLLKRSN